MAGSQEVSRSPCRYKQRIELPLLFSILASSTTYRTKLPLVFVLIQIPYTLSFCKRQQQIVEHLTLRRAMNKQMLFVDDEDNAECDAKDLPCGYDSCPNDSPKYYLVRLSFAILSIIISLPLQMS